MTAPASSAPFAVFAATAGPPEADAAVDAAADEADGWVGYESAMPGWLAFTPPLDGGAEPR